MNILTSSRTSKSKNAFTLIEIMVATVIMVVLTGLVIQITSEVLKVWNRSSGKLSANSEARIAMDLLTQDLETAVFRNNGQQWLRVESPQNPEGPYNDQTVALKLFSPALDRDQFSPGDIDIPGDICAIGYRLSYREAYDGADDKIYALYRSIARPDDTFNLLMGSSSDMSSPQLKLEAQSFWDKTDIEVDNNYLAGNIVDFKVILYEDDGTATPNPVNWDPATDALLPGDYAFGGANVTLITNPLIYAEIRLTVLSDEGLRVLENLIGSGYANVDDVVREHGEIFTRRVNFLARPL